MTYVLEGAGEAQRLEAQSQNANYDYRAELSGFSMREKARVLDAGCGSGIVTRYLAESNPACRVIGCDASADRIDFAKKAAKQLANAEFHVSDLSKLDFETGTFGAAVCRYVLQHVARGAPVNTALGELFRVLEPGGKLLVIETDAQFVNLRPLSPALHDDLSGVVSASPVDLFIGRKLPALLDKAGFKNLHYESKTIECVGDTLLGEAALNEQRLTAALPVLERHFGGSKRAREFISDYVGAMRAPGATYLITKCLITGEKPRKRPLRALK